MVGNKPRKIVSRIKSCFICSFFILYIFVVGSCCFLKYFILLLIKIRSFLLVGDDRVNYIVIPLQNTIT